LEELPVELSYHTEGGEQVFIAKTDGAEITFRWSDDSVMWAMYENLEDMRQKTVEMVDQEHEVIRFRKSLDTNPEQLFD
jgi:hypothetical protein